MEKKGQFPILIEESPKKLRAKEKALKISVEEGAVASVSSSVGDGYITPFALALNAKAFHIGVISALSGLLAPLAQIFGSKLMENRSRKTIVMKFVLLQALMWLPLTLLGLFYWKGIFQAYSIYSLIIIYTLILIFGGIALPAWFSWMGDLAPEQQRGSYFAKRNRTTGLVGLSAALIAAFMLDAFKTKGLALVGFSILFFLAFTFRLISFMFFHKQFSPKFKLKKKSYFTFWQFLKRHDNFGKFSIYIGAFNLALMIASPFFAVFMLEELNFSYRTFMIVNISSSLFYLLLQPLAGKFSDKFGNKKLLVLANLLFASYPLFWLFLRSPVWIIFIPQFISGIANAAWSIGTTNFMYDSASVQHRGLCLSYTNVLGGIGTFIGALLGGFLVNIISIQSISPFLAVFVISAVLRLSIVFIFLPKITDSENRKIGNLPPVHINFGHPFRAIHNELVWVKTVFK